MIYPLSFGSWLTCPRPADQLRLKVKGSGWPFGKEREKRLVEFIGTQLKPPVVRIYAQGA